MATRLEVRTSLFVTPVLVQRGLFDSLGWQLLECLREAPTSIALISDSNVGPLYAERAMKSLAELGPLALTEIVPAGEASKSGDLLLRLSRRMAAAGLDRNALVVALGGGVVTDLAGFAASIFKRGIGFVPVPSSLLGQVDAAIGGKTGIDLPEGKNLVGTFHHPRAVIIDPNLLHSLPAEEWRNGLGEVLKYAVMGDSEMFAQLDQCDPASLRSAPEEIEPLVARCAGMKTDVCSRDPNDLGERQGLNLGHTIGHALEAAAGFSSLHHGEAVALGLIGEADLAARLGLADPHLRESIQAACGRLGLPTRAEGLDPAEVRAFLLSDKKRVGAALRFALPLRIGAFRIVDVEDPTLIDLVLARLTENS
ncbi:MAG: 3-dehydroquinate synthase [Planctomycetota bacterium]